MERKEDSSRRITRRKYEEKHKERRKQTSGNFGTMIPRALYDEVNEFLRVNNITKVRLPLIVMSILYGNTRRKC